MKNESEFKKKDDELEELTEAPIEKENEFGRE
jgi:hypothetical protein